MIFSLLIYTSLALAQDEKSAFERSLERDTSVKSDESWVEIKGQRFRKIEFNGGNYYVQFRAGNAETADVYCLPPEGHEQEHLTDSEVRTFKRSAGFVQAFHESCSKVNGTKKTALRLNPALGLENPDGTSFTERKKVKIPTH